MKLQGYKTAINRFALAICILEPYEIIRVQKSKNEFNQNHNGEIAKMVQIK